MPAEYRLHVVVTEKRKAHVIEHKIYQENIKSGQSLFNYLSLCVDFLKWKGVDAWYRVDRINKKSINVYRPGMQNVIASLQKLSDEMQKSPQTGVWTIYLYDDDGSGTLPAHTPAEPPTTHTTSPGKKLVNADLHLPCFTVPEWQYIALEPHQRKHLASKKMDELVKSWEAHQTATGIRIALMKYDINTKTWIHQKRDIRSKVFDVPSGFMCMRPPDNAKALLRPANAALDSLFADIKRSEQKFDDYLRPMNKTSPSYTYERKDLGITSFNYCSPQDYMEYGRVSSPKDFRGFLRSEPEFAALDKFVSIYIKAIARYFCGSADATPENLERIEQTINDHGDLDLIKYEDQCGMGQHIDNSLRSDATVFTIGVGRDVVYDMSRAFGRSPGQEVCMIRSCNPEGTMMVLDGESRYMWTHGIPHSEQPSGVKYTIHIGFFHTAGLTARIGKCKELDIPMYRSLAYSLPLHRTQSSPAPKTHSNLHIGAQYASLLNLLAQLQTPHMPDRIRRPGLPPVHPRPGWI